MITLENYLDSAEVAEDLKELIVLISKQALPIRNAFIENQSYAGTENKSGEIQAELDVWSDEHLINVLRKSSLVRELASEEQPEVLKFDNAKADYAVVMDPLDGSSLIQVNLCVGTIIGIYDNGRALNRGEELTAAMYMLYGPMNVLVLTVGKGVYVFAMDGENRYKMLDGPVKMPEGKIYGSGALRKEWTLKHKRFIEEIEEDGGKLRYSGSFVADFHQILRYGGVYCYPGTDKKPEGKLRLVFEANPIGFIAKQAGGAISDGSTNLLTVKPKKADHKTPIYVGSAGLISKLESM
ncbi:class 1 fructose-bisphosphatase [Methanoplanus endosymbiosus]|uniref:Fructose-1,6-bisphosphatase class 1 n=1 Tax=Methanoplanus endosymbiosus TaxID=33865 RepID=A0A9E7THH9_9EURY|nr:class 1 fructose-bisphosphatase [Methanoplanus endosymbiosus]UUX92937.1 fructose-1,6-bisphosphatase [Methanoplanus endosymbiosus]